MGKCRYSRSKQSLVHTVEDGVAGVELDGGEGGLPGGGGSSNGDGTGSVGNGSRSDDLRGGMGNVGNNGGRGGGSQRGDKAVGVGGNEAVGVGKGESGSNNLGGTPLPLGRGGGNGSLLGGVSLGESSLSCDDLLGVSDLDSLEDGGRGLDSLEDGGDKAGSASNGKVGALDTESVDVISDVVDSLDQAVGINILVGAGGHSVGVAGLSPGRWTAGMAERELTKLILSVELVGGGGGGDC